MSDIGRQLTQLYELLTDNSIDTFSAYCIIPEEDEGEIEYNKIGLNKEYWTKWSTEKKLEVVLHEFAHIDEKPHHLDHDFAFYTRLQKLATEVYENHEQVESLLETSVDPDDLRKYLINSVNEYTIEDSMDKEQVQLYLSHTLPRS